MILDGVSPQRLDRKDLVMKSLIGMVFYSNMSEDCVRIRNWELTTLIIVLPFPIHHPLLHYPMWLTRGFMGHGTMTLSLAISFWRLYCNGFKHFTIVIVAGLSFGVIFMASFLHPFFLWCFLQLCSLFSLACKLQVGDRVVDIGGTQGVSCHVVLLV